MGDLHIKSEHMGAYEAARDDLKAALATLGGDEQLLVQLGDVGTGRTSGMPEAFQTANAFLRSFELPFSVITGNHDLEGRAFETDAQNLAAWQAAFQQHHYWLQDVGPCLLVGLSTTRFRSNVLSHHEVHIDDEQLAWFADVLESVQTEKPVVVFTHAPPMGCGLKVINDLHIKNRCAWLNHSTSPGVFMELVARHPRLRVWLSGHFHLSHNYADSVVSTGGCVFVQTGVIGPHCHRDGHRQSRIVRATQTACEVHTVDHEDGGRIRLDAVVPWSRAGDACIVTPDDEIICDVAAGYVCARDACSVLWHDHVRWFPIGPDTLLAQQDGMLLEYDVHTFAATGAVTLDLEGSHVRLLDQRGADVTEDVPGDGSCVAVVQIVDDDGVEEARHLRNAWGTFFTVYQPNKWQLQHGAREPSWRNAAGALPVA